MNLNKNIFREYDIRGIADIDFKGKFPFRLGQAFAHYIIKNEKGKNIAVSGDVRLSTDRLKADFITGLSSIGVNVVDIGTLPTPINYFSNYFNSEKIWKIINNFIVIFMSFFIFLVLIDTYKIIF